LVIIWTVRLGILALVMIVLAMILGMFGLFLFGGIGIVAGIRVGASGALVPLLGWSALFATLGYNFIDYGLFNPPPGEGVVWGWLVPGVLFEIMGIGPLAFVVWAVRGSRDSDPSLALEKLQAARMAAASARRSSEAVAEPKPRATTDALDRLERLAGLRERGLLGADEFEEAKAAVMRDLASGPVGRARLEHRLPHGFHGSFANGVV